MWASPKIVPSTGKATSTLLVAVLLVGTLTVGTAYAADVSWNKLGLLVLRILAYDQKLAARAGDTLVIAIVYEPSSDASQRVKNGILSGLKTAVASRTVAGLPVQLLPIAYGGDFERELGRSRAAAVYLCPYLESGMAVITRATSKHKVLSISSDRAYVESGTSIGVVPSGDKMKIVVNLPVSRREGADLAATFLHIAEVIK